MTIQFDSLFDIGNAIGDAQLSANLAEAELLDKKYRDKICENFSVSFTFLFIP